MVSLRTAVCLLVTAALSLVVASVAFCPDSCPELPARSSGSTTDPVAVIDPIADTVSNSTGFFLYGLNSYDYDDAHEDVNRLLANYTWEITHGDVTVRAYGSIVWYRFHELGLYEIRLTVADSWGNTGVNFTALIAVDDRDNDGLPDWWEMAFMGSVSPSANSDYDSDGYTNLYEWYAGTLPNVADPPPPSPDILGEYWAHIVVAAAAIAILSVVAYIAAGKRRKEREEKKIAIAVELEKTLDEE